MVYSGCTMHECIGKMHERHIKAPETNIKERRYVKGEMCMKGIFKRRGKKLTAVATAFALLCTAGVIPENVLPVSAAENETGGMEEQIPEEELAIDGSNFPDANFRKVLSKFDSNDDGFFSKEELSLPYVVGCAW